MKPSVRLAAATAAALFVGVGAASAQSPAEGVWSTAKGEGRVQIARCEDKLCGYAETDSEREPRALLSAFAGGPEVWTGGEITDPRTGKRYRGRLAVLSSDRLQVTGCLIGPLCASEIWRRSGS